MRIVADYKGYQLVERYGRDYIRFWGGREEDMPCEIPISHEHADQCLSELAFMEEIIVKKKEDLLWTADTFYRIGIFQYLLYSVGITGRGTILKQLDKFSQHEDIRNEFYQFIVMSEVFPEDSVAIKVEGYTAKYLFSHYPLSAIGAYNFLIYLREKPDEAKANLKAGLPTKDFRRGET